MELVSLIRLVSICYGNPDVPLTFRGCNGPGGIRPLGLVNTKYLCSIYYTQKVMVVLYILLTRHIDAKLLRVCVCMCVCVCVCVCACAPNMTNTKAL